MSRVRNAVLLLCMLTCALALPPVASANSKSIQMLQQVNNVRAQAGLPALHFSQSLAHSASSYSHKMMRGGYYGHAGRIQASRRFRTLGEILEYQRGGPKIGQSMHDWMNSPEHRSIILSRAFSFAGAGYVTGRFHGRTATIWVMHFGRH
ncbi:MAG: hypothetical protein QOF37_1653 [Thermoleophilaceae bacterium]|jgi:uncharacterized protein YkwD|nr:hypothetical protein [Thermoleophilaceae bacterium]